MTSENKPWCTCGSQLGWTHLWDQWWVHPNCGKPTKLFWEKKMGLPSEQGFWAPPPPGLTKSTARIGPDVYELFTYRCEQSDACYALEYSKNADHARRAIEGHICPAPPRRDQTPNGKTAVQRMWDELDDLIDQIKFVNARPELKDFDQIERTGQATGIAFALALLLVPYFRTADDILRQANKRWKMRQKEIPWEQTPGYNYYPAAPLAFAQPEERPKPARKAVRSDRKMEPMVQAPPPTRKFTVAEIGMIKDSVHGKGMNPADLANMFGVTAERIKTIAGPPPSADDTNFDLPIAMF